MVDSVLESRLLRRKVLEYELSYQGSSGFIVSNRGTNK